LKKTETPKPIRATVDMLVAFQTMANILNLTEVANQLNVTRQTVKRHLKDFEELKGQDLFTLHRGRYQLTEVGRDTLTEVSDIVQRIDGLSPSNRYVLSTKNGYEHSKYVDEDDIQFFAQQHSVGSPKLFHAPLIEEMVRAWGNGLTTLYHPAMDRIRPFLVVYRRSVDGWICVEVGDKSAYARWFGEDQARSAQGVLSQADDVGDDYNAFISRAYEGINSGGGIRLDHIYARLPRSGWERPQPVSFQRILAGCAFPDGQRALAVLVVMTDRIEVDALSGQTIEKHPLSLSMDEEAI
jgi:hypothetical protein